MIIRRETERTRFLVNSSGVHPPARAHEPRPHVARSTPTPHPAGPGRRNIFLVFSFPSRTKPTKKNPVASVTNLSLNSAHTRVNTRDSPHPQAREVEPRSCLHAVALQPFPEPRPPPREVHVRFAVGGGSMRASRFICSSHPPYASYSHDVLTRPRAWCFEARTGRAEAVRTGEGCPRRRTLCRERLLPARGRIHVHWPRRVPALEGQDAAI